MGGKNKKMFYFATTIHTYTHTQGCHGYKRTAPLLRTPQITHHIKRSFPLNCIVILLTNFVLFKPIG